jgi:plasmid maintenance system antidote protein VapI
VSHQDKDLEVPPQSSKIAHFVEPAQALDETIKLFKIKATDLAELTGIGENRISKYRNNKGGMNVDTLFRLVRALPLRARLHFMALVILPNDD